MMHQEEVLHTCNSAIKLLIPRNPKIKFRPMHRKRPINPRKGYVIGRTSLKTGLITIDILTPVKREPKKVSSILKTLCHEIAHHQKPPFRQLYKWKFIIRQHYPEFYHQVAKNIDILKNHKEFKKYFV